MNKNFVCLDLTLSDKVAYWKQQHRWEQTPYQLRQMLYKIHKEIAEDKSEHRWNDGTKGKYKRWYVTACISNMSLSDDKEDNEKTTSELGKGKNNRLANWHIHVIFYSPSGDLKNLLHVANGFRSKWINKYHLGGISNNIAKDCEVSKWYYAKYQSIKRISLDSQKGKLPLKVWDSIIQHEYDALTEAEKKRENKKYLKWKKRREDCFEVMKKNLSYIGDSPLQFAKVFSAALEDFKDKEAIEAMFPSWFEVNIESADDLTCFSDILMILLRLVRPEIQNRFIFNVDASEENILKAINQ